MSRRLIAALTAAAGAIALFPSVAAAHTGADVVGVASGDEAVVTLRPTHGCGDSPTVRVRIRAPFPDATAEEVPGWTASATPDGNGNTVLEWSGGSLPSPETGAFPVEFDVTAEPGTLLLFPAVQQCENGEELAWIDGDPAGERPAPRVLVLPIGSEAAATIDDVPADAPGREQLVEIVDVDNGDATTTTTPTDTTPVTITPTPSTDASSTEDSTTTLAPTGQTDAPGETTQPPLVAPPPESTDAPAATDATGRDDGGNDGNPGGVIALVVSVLVIVGGGFVIARRQRGARPPQA